MLSIHFAMRALPALMMLMFVAACSRAPEPEPVAKADASAAEVIIIGTPESGPDPRHLVLTTGFPAEDERLAMPLAEFEDPSDGPNKDLSANPNDDPSGWESPHPNRSANAVGIGGGTGGGGGFGYRRARGGGGRAEVARSSPAPSWLSDHQNKEGYWSADKHDDDSTRGTAAFTHNIEFKNIGKHDGDVGLGDHDILVTALALLTYTGAGYDHKSGEHRAAVRMAILFLRKAQDNEGCFGDKGAGHLLRHAITTMAMAEAYGLSGDNVLKPLADKAVAYLLKAQFKGSGWGHEDADLLTTAWCVLALKSAAMAGLTFDAGAALKDAQKFLDQMLVEEKGYKVARFNATSDHAPGSIEKLALNEAAWIVASLFTGERDINDADIKQLGRLLTEKDNLPAWEEGKLDFQYWYFASLAAFQLGGTVWKAWEKPLSTTILEHQRG